MFVCQNVLLGVTHMEIKSMIQDTIEVIRKFTLPDNKMKS